MSAPTGPGPLTDLAAVNAILGRAPDHAEAADMVAAVNSLVPTWLRPGGAGWADHQRTGAALLAARLDKRKDATGGTFGLEGGVGYVQSNWPDIAMMLGVGSYAVGRTG
jgi:hypothetical protein